MDIEGRFSVLIYDENSVHKLQPNCRLLSAKDLPDLFQWQIERKLAAGEQHVLVLCRIDGESKTFTINGISLPKPPIYCLISEIAKYVQGFDSEDLNIFLCAHGYLERNRNTGRSNTVYNYHPTDKAEEVWYKRKNGQTLLWERQFIFDLLEQWRDNGKACFRTPSECAKIFGYSEEQLNAILEIRGYQTVSNGKCYPSKKLKEGETGDCHYTEYEDGKPLWNVFKIKFAMHRDRTGGGYE